MKATPYFASLAHSGKMSVFTMPLIALPFAWSLTTGELLPLINILPTLCAAGMFIQVCLLSSICHETPQSKSFNDKTRTRSKGAMKALPPGFRSTMTSLALIMLPCLAVSNVFTLTIAALLSIIFFGELKNLQLNYIYENQLQKTTT